VKSIFHKVFNTTVENFVARKKICIEIAVPIFRTGIFFRAGSYFGPCYDSPARVVRRKFP